MNYSNMEKLYTSNMEKLYTRMVKQLDPRLYVTVEKSVNERDHDFFYDWIVVLDRAPQSNPSFYDLVSFESLEDLKVWIYELDEMDAQEEEAEIADLVSRAKSLLAHPASARA